MADAPASPTPWLDLLDEDIPVVDKSGKQLLVKGLDFVDAGKGPAAPAPAAPAAAPAIAPAKPSVASPPAALDIVEKTEAPVRAAPESSLAKVTKDDFLPDASKDAADLKKIEAIVAKKDVSVETKAEANLLDTTVEQAAASTGAALADEDMKRRYRMLISLYFRDLRDSLETKSKFTMPVQSGGMGMSDEDAEKAIAELKRRNDEYHAAMQGKAAGDKAKYVAEQTEKVLGAQEKLDRQDTQRMEQAFSGLMQRTGVAAPGAAVPPSSQAAPKEPKFVPVVGLDAKGKAMPSAAPQPAAQAVPAAAPQVKPAASDVKYSPRLTGPVEELRSMSLADFRRLSRDPREATLKLKDKIDLLEEQSFDMKTQGIKAWQDSEVNKLYLDILRASLEGKPVTDVIAALENKAAPFLSKAEFDSIMELNRKLRFG